MGTVPTVWRATAERTPQRLKGRAGRSRRAIRRRLGPGAGRTHFGMKWVGRGNVIPIGYGEATRGGVKGARNERHGLRLRKRRYRRAGSRGRISYECPRNEGV